MTPMEMEFREWGVDSLEIRGSGAGQVVGGQGVPYDRMSEDMGGWREVIRPGAATESLRDNDIAMLWAHDQAQPVSRVSASRHALVLEERKSGVWFEQAAAAFTEFQLSKISDRVVGKMSFGFFVEDFEKDQRWTEGSGGKLALREIFKLNLREISPVVFPAYPSTKVAVRSAIASGIVLSGRVGRTPSSGQQPRDAARELASDRKRMAAVAHLGVDVRREAQPLKAELDALPADDYLRFWATCYHEAGHAVAHVLAGNALTEVGLRREKRDDGSWRRIVGACKSRSAPLTPLILMAGVAAEELNGYPTRIVGKGSDADWTRAGELSTKHSVDEDLAEARTLLRLHWSAVRALAHRLFAEQVVDGATAEGIILENLDAATCLPLRRGRVA